MRSLCVAGVAAISLQLGERDAAERSQPAGDDGKRRAEPVRHETRFELAECATIARVARVFVRAIGNPALKPEAILMTARRAA